MADKDRLIQILEEAFFDFKIAIENGYQNPKTPEVIDYVAHVLEASSKEIRSNDSKSV